MPGQFDDFMRTPVGKAIAGVIRKGDGTRLTEYEAFSREGFPAVTALVSELVPILEPMRKSDPKKFNFAKQSIGAEVAVIMSDAGYQKEGSRSVPGKLFTVGAVWKKRT